MLDRLRQTLDADRDVAYALLFGSAARGATHGESDVDIAVGLRAEAARDVGALDAER